MVECTILMRTSIGAVLQDTPFSEMYDVKKKEAGKEVLPFIVLIHKVPKQVADAAQTQGVSEKFLENGMPSGILTPSQISHDRMLSVVDALQDAVVIGILLAFMPLFSYGTWMSITAFLMCLYWFFHVAWWEKGKAWDIKASVKRYLKNTYNYYWVIFTIAIIAVSFSVWYLIFLVGAQIMMIEYTNIALQQASIVEHAFADIFREMNLNPNAQYAIALKGDEYKMRFLVAYLIFIAVTVAAKIYFSKLYKREREINSQHSEEELYYTAESALKKLGGLN